MTIKVFGIAQISDRLEGVTKDKEYPIIRVSAKADKVTFIDDYGRLTKTHACRFTYITKEG